MTELEKSLCINIEHSDNELRNFQLIMAHRSSYRHYVANMAQTIGPYLSAFDGLGIKVFSPEQGLALTLQIIHRAPVALNLLLHSFMLLDESLCKCDRTRKKFGEGGGYYILQ